MESAQVTQPKSTVSRPREPVSARSIQTSDGHWMLRFQFEPRPKASLHPGPTPPATTCATSSSGSADGDGNASSPGNSEPSRAKDFDWTVPIRTHQCNCIVVRHRQDPRAAGAKIKLVGRWAPAEVARRRHAVRVARMKGHLAMMRQPRQPDCVDWAGFLPASKSEKLQAWIDDVASQPWLCDPEGPDRVDGLGQASWE